MKTLKLLLILFLGMVLMASSCEPEEIEEPCKCEIEGTKQISFDNGETWLYNDTDGRTGMMFPCHYDGLATNQRNNNGVLYRTYWECR